MSERKIFINGPYKTHTKIASTLGMLHSPMSEVLSYLPRVSRSQEVIIGALLVSTASS